MATFDTKFCTGQSVWFLDAETVRICTGTVQAIIIVVPAPTKPGVTHEATYSITTHSGVLHSIKEEYVFTNKHELLAFIKGLEN